MGATILRVCFGKVKSEARPDQLITLTRRLREARRSSIVTCRRPRSIKPARSNSRAAFVMVGRWTPSISASRLLSDRERVTVTAITHHQQPTRQPLLEAVRTVARYRHHDLFEKGLDVGVHETSEGRHRLHGRRERCARHPRGASGICTISWTEDRLAPKMACIPLQPSLPIVAISMMLPSA